MEKSPPSDGTGSITAGDLQAQSIIGAVCISPIPAHPPARDDNAGGHHWIRLRHEGSEGAVPHFDCPTACGGKVVAPATKGGMSEWYMKYMTLCFSPQISCFPLRWQGNLIRKEPQATENQVTRFPTGREGGGDSHQRGPGLQASKGSYFHAKNPAAGNCRI